MKLKVGEEFASGRTGVRVGKKKSTHFLICSVTSLSINSVQFSCSVAQFSVTLCEPMDSSMPGFPVHHQLLELAQTHVHQVGDAIQLFHPLSSPSLPTFNLSQHQGLFQ